MTPIDLNLGPDIVVKGCLYNSMEPRFLRDDILEIDLPSGVTLSVGWNSQKHRFDIVAFRDFWEDQIRSSHATSISGLIDQIQWLSQQFYSGAESTAASASDAEEPLIHPADYGNVWKSCFGDQFAVVVQPTFPKGWLPSLGQNHLSAHYG
jgi:hypothetical protein